VPLAAARGLESAIDESLGDGARRLTGYGERRHELAQRLGVGNGGGAIGRSLLGIAQLDAASLGGGERELGALRNHPPLLLGDGRAPLPRSARKPATASAKRLMPTQMSARCFAQVSCSSRLFMRP
jgi:hypothetical protein